MAVSKAELDRAETIAAIALNFGTSKKYPGAYKAAGESMGGFTGFYGLAVHAGIALESYAKKRGIDWGDNADWIDTTDAYADSILDFCIQFGRAPSGKDFDRLAESSVR